MKAEVLQPLQGAQLQQRCWRGVLRTPGQVQVSQLRKACDAGHGAIGQTLALDHLHQCRSGTVRAKTAQRQEQLKISGARCNAPPLHLYSVPVAQQQSEAFFAGCDCSTSSDASSANGRCY